MSSKIEIRPYQENDRQGVYRVAADTVFFGEPVETFLDDRRLLCDAFVKYYLDFEAEYAWVAAIGDGSVVDRIAGYLTGCVDSASQLKKRLRWTIVPLFWNVLLGKYLIGGKTWRHARAMLGGILRREYPHVDYGKYPAHLHINVDVSMRGRGLGRRLMGAYLDQIRHLGVPAVFLSTTTANEAAIRLYERQGFRLLEGRRTKVWNYLMERPVENCCYGLKLESIE